MKSLIAIPCFNHNDYLPELINKINSYIDIDILVIDDGSENIVSKQIIFNENKSNLHLIRNNKNSGKGYSLIKAFQYCKNNNYTHMITVDADMQHHPSSIPEILNISLKYDLVYGMRNFKKNMPLQRVFSNVLTSKIISLICKNKIYDSQCGLRRYNISKFNYKDCIEMGYQFETEILLNSIDKSFSIKSVPINTIYNGSSSSINVILDTCRFIRCIIKAVLL